MKAIRLFKPFTRRKTPLPIITTPKSTTHEPTGYLACVAIVRNEARYLEEWVSFHLLAGFEHIYLYDNESTDKTHSVLMPFVRAGKVTVIRWPHFFEGQNTQCLAYSHAVSALRNEFRWLAFIDADEFLFPVKESSLVHVLQDYEDVPSLGVYWINFGTGGNVEYQRAGVLDSYFMRQELGIAPQGTTLTNYKSIVQPAKIDGIISAHAFKSSLYPILALDEERRPIFLEQYRRVSCNRIRINHYFTKSEIEWNEKLARSSCRANGHSVKDRRVAFLEELGPMKHSDHLIVEVRRRLEMAHNTQVRSNL